jgi:hypothetical protein
VNPDLLTTARFLPPVEAAYPTKDTAAAPVKQEHKKEDEESGMAGHLYPVRLNVFSLFLQESFNLF